MHNAMAFLARIAWRTLPVKWFGTTSRWTVCHCSFSFHRSCPCQCFSEHDLLCLVQFQITKCFVQQPKIGGEVRPHQDSTFLRTDPPSVIGLWWALEDATKQNGCLWALPGAHAQGVARHFIRK